MAKAQVKKAQIQAENAVFALDIGTRSIIGMVGVVEDGKVKIVAIEKEEHTERAMVDGQIENIEKVTTLARKVKKRLEDKVHCKLNRVCVAAAGRALRTKRAEYEIDLKSKQLIDDEIISRLEAGAINKVEEAFDAENSAEEDMRRFYLVGYTVCQYYLDDYKISSLKDHRGQNVKVDLIATFLPSEVVESLYTTMNKIGLEVVSITLEPIAAINAAIPENLRLLNLVMVDIGAGTSDIAACTGGSVTGYTMATVAGDEVTEAIMREYLVDFQTAEGMKAQIEQEEVVTFTDILGFERKASREEVLQCIQSTSELLSKEIAQKVLEVNGGTPSALFLAGGGSKLAGLKEGITAALSMDANRVAIAGNNFKISAFSDEYDLNNPEYTTPLGITVSSGLNLINDSFRVTLNGRAAKLFRSGSFTALNLLMMNGYNFQDILGRPGTSLTVTVNGKRKVFYGTAAMPSSLFINKKEGKLSTVINAGDCIDFEPAIPGVPAKACLGDIEGANECSEITLNGREMPLDTPLKIGDVIRIRMPKTETGPEKAESEEMESERESKKAESETGESKRAESEAGKAEIKDEGAGTKPKDSALEPESAVSEPELKQETVVPETEPALDRETKAMGDEAEVGKMEVVAEAEKAGPELRPEIESGAVKPKPDFENGLMKTGSDVKEEVKPEDAADKSAQSGQTSVIEIAGSDDAGESDDGIEFINAGEFNDIIGADYADGPEDMYELDSMAESLDEKSESSKFEDVEAVIRESGLLKRHGKRAKKTEEGQLVLNFDQGEEKVSAEEPEPEKVRKEAPTPVRVQKENPVRGPETVSFRLNGSVLRLPKKEGGTPYYLMDMIQYSGINIRNPKGKINLMVNGEPGMFQQRLAPGDVIVIEEEKL